MAETKAELMEKCAKLEAHLTKRNNQCKRQKKELTVLRKQVDAFESGRMPYCGKTCGQCAYKFALNGDPKERIRCRKQPGMKSVHFDSSHTACADWMPHGC